MMRLATPRSQQPRRTAANTAPASSEGAIVGRRWLLFIEFRPPEGGHALFAAPLAGAISGIDRRCACAGGVTTHCRLSHTRRLERIEGQQAAGLGTAGTGHLSRFTPGSRHAVAVRGEDCCGCPLAESSTGLTGGHMSAAYCMHTYGLPMRQAEDFALPDALASVTRNSSCAFESCIWMSELWRGLGRSILGP